VLWHRPRESGGCEGRAATQEWGWDTHGTGLTKRGKTIGGGAKHNSSGDETTTLTAQRVAPRGEAVPGPANEEKQAVVRSSDGGPR
jgi:hypothetical protein